MKKLLHERLRDFKNSEPEFVLDNGNKIVALYESVAKALADEIEREYIPRPRFEDGEPVLEGCTLDRGIVDEIQVSNSGCYVIYDDRGNELSIGYPGDRVKRPQPKVLDADGVEGTNGEGYDFACSACGYLSDITEPNYCPNCGARVIEE